MLRLLLFAMLGMGTLIHSTSTGSESPPSSQTPEHRGARTRVRAPGVPPMDPFSHTSSVQGNAPIPPLLTQHWAYQETSHGHPNPHPQLKAVDYVQLSKLLREAVRLKGDATSEDLKFQVDARAAEVESFSQSEHWKTQPALTHGERLLLGEALVRDGQTYAQWGADSKDDAQLCHDIGLGLQREALSDNFLKERYPNLHLDIHVGSGYSDYFVHLPLDVFLAKPKAKDDSVIGRVWNAFKGGPSGSEPVVHFGVM